MSDYNSRSRGRRKKKKGGLTTFGKIVVIILILILIAAGIFVATKILNKESSAEMDAEIVTLEPESELSDEVLVGGVNITGKGRTEAKHAIEKKYPWDVKVTLSGSTDPVYEVPNLTEPGIEKLLDEIYGGQPKESYELNLTIDQAALDAAIEEMKAKWNVEALNGSITGFDKETETFTYGDAKPGYEVDTDSVRAQLEALEGQQKFKATIKATGHEVEPEFNEDEAKAKYTTIGSFYTKSTANPDRNNNLNLAANAIDGTLLQVGEEFTFNLTTGNRTTEKGYKAAGAYQNGELVEEPGGGVCQVASTLYNAVVQAGIEVTERHAHTFEPSYVTPGNDATVSYDGYSGPDLKFVNNTSSAIVVRANYEDQTVHCWIIGIPILPEGQYYELKSEKVATLEVPAPAYEDDPTIPPHTEQQVSEGDEGSRWETYLVLKNGDAVISTSEEPLHITTYKGHTPKIKRNLTDVQVNEEGLIVRQVETNEAGEIVSESLGPGYVPSEGESTSEGQIIGSVPAAPGSETRESSSAVTIPTTSRTLSDDDMMESRNQTTEEVIEAPTAPDEDYWDEPVAVDAPGF